MNARKLTDRLPRTGDALIVVPPFYGTDCPAYGVHLLQACAREHGFRTSIVYANLSLARLLGEQKYKLICYAPTFCLIGERLFSALAYGLPRLGKHAESFLKEVSALTNLSFDELAVLEEQLAAWMDELVEEIAALDYPIIGCTTAYEQTSASIAILQALKKRLPSCTTILGGANCEGEMAKGVHTLTPALDYIFSGESESSFVSFLESFAKRQLPSDYLIEGKLNRALDKLPTPDFQEYYDQFDCLGAEHLKKRMWLPYETSRGCWWGEKKHCTFCGINGQGMSFRQKSPSRVIDDLKTLLKRHPTTKVRMLDNIMPFDYFSTLLPRLATEVGRLNIWYEQKSNATFEKVKALKESGVTSVLFGIEALSSPLLKLMQKGATSAQQVRVLRFSRAMDLTVNWQLIYAFPGDKVEWYEDTTSLIPYITHLAAPTALLHLSIDRFSPYFDTPETFGVTKILPMAQYYNVFPESADVPKAAYHFTATYQSESKAAKEAIRNLSEVMESWQRLWVNPAESPSLNISPVDENSFMLFDSRPIRVRENQLLTREQASAALSGRFTDDSQLDWARENKLVYKLDGEWLPLATADYQVFCDLTQPQATPRAHLQPQLAPA